MSKKVCTKCGRELPLEGFSTDKRNKSGYGAWCKECHNICSKNWKEKHPEEYTKALWRCRLQKEYRITESDYEIMFNEQNGVCAICGQSETRLHINGKITKLCVDHNHNTGKVRGLLCHRCNTVIGMFDSVELLDNAKEYILKENENGEEN